MPSLRPSLAHLDHRMTQAFAASANRSVDFVAEKMEIYVPRGTGELADSIEIHHVAGGVIAASVAIGEGLSSPGEAAAVEWGTATRHPTPYFRPACNQGIAKAIPDMHRSIHESIN